MGGASLAGRPGCCCRCRCRRHVRTSGLHERPTGARRRGRGLATCASPPVPSRRSPLTAPPLRSRRRRGSARLSGLAGRPRMRHALPGARGLAPPGLAPPEPAREPTRRRAPAEGNPREAIGRPEEARAGSSAVPGLREAAGDGGGGPGQVGSPAAPRGLRVRCLPPGTSRSPWASSLGRGEPRRQGELMPFLDPSTPGSPTALARLHPRKAPRGGVAMGAPAGGVLGLLALGLREAF